MSDDLKFYGFVIFNNMASNIYTVKAMKGAIWPKTILICKFFLLWFPYECIK